jgi:drug/metabolite transporter (DMT)-like permease
MIGTMGIFLLVLNGIKYKTELLGNGIALIAMLFDVISALALILYVKQENKFEGIDYILHRIVILGVLFSPAALYYLYHAAFTQIEIYALLFQAIFPTVLAHYCVYEAFKRLDGFVNYLLFNLSFIITLTLETLFFDLQLSLMLVIGAFFIISSSILAEYINTTTSKRRT